MKKILLCSVFGLSLFCKDDVKSSDNYIENTTCKGRVISEKKLEELASNISLNPLKQGPSLKVIETVASEVVKEKDLSISAKDATKKIVDNIMTKRDEVAGVFRFELSPETIAELYKFSKTDAGKEWFNQVGAISHATSGIVMDALQEAIEILEEKYSRKKKTGDKEGNKGDKKDSDKKDKKAKEGNKDDK